MFTLLVKRNHAESRNTLAGFFHFPLLFSMLFPAIDSNSVFSLSFGAVNWAFKFYQFLRSDAFQFWKSLCPLKYDGLNTKLEQSPPLTTLTSQTPYLLCLQLPIWCHQTVIMRELLICTNNTSQLKVWMLQFSKISFFRCVTVWSVKCIQDSTNKAKRYQASHEVRFCLDWPPFSFSRICE